MCMFEKEDCQNWSEEYKRFVVLPFLSLIDMSREKFYLFQLEYGCKIRQDNHDDYLFTIISDTSKN